jgi:glutathione synthase
MSAKAKARKKKPFHFLWITDPWDTLDHPKDTTLRLAEEALTLGAEVFWCDVKTIRSEKGHTWLDARQILQIYPGRAEKAFRLGEPTAMRPVEFDSLHYRTDPPVDLAYLQPLQILMMGLPRGSRSELVNPGSVLFLGNEKLEASALGPLMPPSIASAQLARLQAFGSEEGRTVLKPLHQAQSKGIELLDWRTEPSTAKAALSLRAATEDFTRPVLLQRYLEGIAQGEQRLWYIDGKLLACVRKLPVPNDFRVDMDRGSRIAPTVLTAAERKAATRIGKHLIARKIRLAAVDLIEGLITDFNFTSPGLIPQMEGVLGENLAKPIVQALMKRT